MSGYTHCAHASCFAIIVGNDGDLCDDCLAEDAEGDASECAGCDNDRDVPAPSKRADDETAHYRSEG
jgi:hypothetical protein